MADSNQWTRRGIVKAAGASAVTVLAGSAGRSLADETKPAKKANSPRKIKQSVCRWCYKSVPLEKLANEAKRIGYQSIELLNPEEYQVIKPLGLSCAMLTGVCQIPDCYNRTKNHDKLNKGMKELIEFAAAEGLPNVICFSGNRRGMSDEEGLANCAEGLKQLMPFAEEKGVTVCMELLNSKVNHADYMCDNSKWGVELVKQVGSPRFKLLYDIYHMQIMEGDVIRTIQDHHDAFGHYHTGGNPGRHEIDETQELNYPAIVKAIIATGYDGYLGQEFIPEREPLASMKQGFEICNV